MILRGHTQLSGVQGVQQLFYLRPARSGLDMPALQDTIDSKEPAIGNSSIPCYIAADDAVGDVII